MEVRKGYKQTEVGVIPDDWDCREIGALVDLLTGFPFPSSGYSKVGIRLLRGSNVKRGNLDWSDEVIEYWPVVTSEIKKYLLKADDIVIAMDGSLVGRSFAMLSKGDEPSLLLQRVARVRSEYADQKFLKAWICSEYFTRHCDAVKTVTAIPHISPADIRTFKVAIPPTLAEQEAIAAALSDVDALLTALDALIAKKRLIKQGAMQELLTGKKRLPGFSGEWDSPKIGDLFIFKNGLNKAKEFFGYGTPIVNYMDVYGKRGIYSNDLRGRVSLSGDEVRAFEVRKGDVFFTRTSETAAEVGISSVMLDQPRDTVFSGFILRARPKDNSLDDQFKKFCFSTDGVRKQITSQSTETTRALTSGRNLSIVAIARPPLEEQKAIAELLNDMDAEIAALEQRREKTRRLKQGMMQELLTGRTRLL